MVEFHNAKNEEKTCSINGVFLHSKYNPSAEGEKFAQNLGADFSPLCIIVLEAGLSYSADFLRKRFPQAKLCTIRFVQDFSEYDKKWDFVFYGAEQNFSNLAEDLYNALGEENLISSIAIDWNPSKNIFPELNLLCWKEIQKALLKSRDVMGTRSYFSKRWLKNSLIFSKNIQSTATIASGNFPVVIAASGPSLKTSLPYIKQNLSRFFLIAVSSAYSPLIKNGIKPDLVLSSDGGFWAKRHLSFPENTQPQLFGIEAEGAAFSSIYSKNTIVPLCYEDGIETEFLKALNCPYMLSKRNGTIAGTALEFAFSLTSGNIFLCGFDQSPATGFQHTQPNALELLNAAKDNRIATKETRTAKSQFGSAASLEIYRNWFIFNSPRFSERVHRLSENYNFEFTLGQIQDINWNQFEEIVEKNFTLPKFKKMELEIDSEKRKQILLQTLSSLLNSSVYEKEIFPMESLLILREINKEKAAQLKEALVQKKQKLFEDLKKLLGEK